mmetsp:Transcript_7958/g.11810  ORF Transcript_7958/g.11810 Transcript_7958/m.11810 type:complete len:286 (-) Transcript_7958:1905-2762(-)
MNLPDVRKCQIIHAKVRIISFEYKGKPIDFSYNQYNGIRTRCYLEYLNFVFGKKNLLKMSILLLKTWCLNESHILASNNGMLSSYALTIMIIQVINMNYEKLNDPFDVLLHFFQEYATFDFKNRIITAFGPTTLGELQSPSTTNVYFTKDEFLQKCPSTYEPPYQAFLPRSINILDPIHNFNNIGRSVSKGAYQRIVICFKRGSEALKKITISSMHQFFRRTLLKFGHRKALNPIYWGTTFDSHPEFIYQEPSIVPSSKRQVNEEDDIERVPLSFFMNKKKKKKH